MTLDGVWVGNIRGTNFGDVVVHLVQTGIEITGVGRLNDLQFGAALYSVSGSSSDQIVLSLRPEQHPLNLNYARVEVVGQLQPSGEISGAWKSPEVDTHGFFTLHRPTEYQVAAGGERRVFVVHGHNQHLRDEVAKFVSSLGLQPVVLDEQPSAGRTIIEKLEFYSSVGFAVVLLTGDDEARAQSGADEPTLRARQNVILELGYFLGKLGRSRVCALFQQGIEMPSDYHGVVFISLEDQSLWRERLALELSQRWPDLAGPHQG